jgi:hypothetical protein
MWGNSRKPQATKYIEQRIFLVDLGQFPKQLAPDIEALKDRFDVEQRGFAEARQGRPSGDQPDAIENEILLEARTRISDICVALQEKINRATSVVTSVQPSEVVPAQSDASKHPIIAQFNGDIATTWANKQDQLVDAYAARLIALQDLRYFQAQHRRTSDAKYPKTVFLPLMALFGFFVLESSLNGVLLGRVNAFGIVGGWAVALGISIINIGMGIFTGMFGLRLLGHRFVLQRLLGWIISLFGLSFAISWNTTVAIYRDVVEKALALRQQMIASGDPGTGNSSAPDLSAMMAEAIDRLINLTISLASLESIMLLFLGFGIFVLATIEGRTGFTDSYWDYKKHDVQFRRANRKWVRVREEYDDEIAEIAADQIERVELSDIEDDDKMSDIQKVTETLKLRDVEARELTKKWNDAQVALISTYRDANKQVRDQSMPAPSYFNTYVDLVAEADIPDASDAADKLFSEVKRRVESNRVARQGVLAEIGKARSDHVSKRDERLENVITQAKKRYAEEAPARPGFDSGTDPIDGAPA